jgi:hypothetical protein
MDIKDLLIQPSEEEATEDVTAHRGRHMDASSVSSSFGSTSNVYASVAVDTSGAHLCTRMKQSATKTPPPALERTFDEREAPAGGNWETVCPVGTRAVAQSDIPGTVNDSLNIGG